MAEKYAVLVVDMLNDFVTGALKCDRGLAIVPRRASGRHAQKRRAYNIL